MKLLIIFALALTFVSCFYIDDVVGVPIVEAEGRITNGEDAAPGQFPYHVILIITKLDRTELCGGSLVSNRHTVTAAHCVLLSLLVEAHFGGTDLKNFKDKRTITPKNMFINKDYNSRTIENDIAILITYPVEFTPYIQPIKLPSADESFVGKTVVVAGLGRWTDASPNPSQKMLYSEFKIVYGLSCYETYGKSFKPSSNMCIRTDNGKSPCQGDSGGGVVEVSDLILAGIISYGSRNCENNKPVACTRVSYFRQWIDDIINST